MAITTEQARNAIRLVECIHDPLCCGYRWQILNTGVLAELVAWTMQGHYRHAETILRRLDGGGATVWPQARQQAIGRLTLPAGTGNDAPRWHRDGLVFQHIAWLAVVLNQNRRVVASTPHLIPAHKGFDALLIPLSAEGRAMDGVIICEEKATDNPRKHITQDIWPSIQSLERGERDAELNNELTAILQRGQVENIDEILTAAHWRNRKAYRISVTTDPSCDRDAERQALFAGYEAHAPGNRSRREAETFSVANLRDWMDNFCSQVVAAVRAT